MADRGDFSGQQLLKKLIELEKEFSDFQDNMSNLRGRIFFVYGGCLKNLHKKRKENAVPEIVTEKFMQEKNEKYQNMFSIVDRLDGEHYIEDLAQSVRDELRDMGIDLVTRLRERVYLTEEGELIKISSKEAVCLDNSPHGSKMLS